MKQEKNKNFCPECGGTLSVGEEKEKSTVLVCDVCGYTEEMEGTSDRGIAKEKSQEPVKVAYDGETERDFANKKCPECGSEKVIMRTINVGGFGVTEQEKRFTCENCGYSWKG